VIKHRRFIFKKGGLIRLGSICSVKKNSSFLWDFEGGLYYTWDMGCFCHLAAYLMAVVALIVLQMKHTVYVQCVNGCDNLQEYILISQNSAWFIVITPDTLCSHWVIFYTVRFIIMHVAKAFGTDCHLKLF